MSGPETTLRDRRRLQTLRDIQDAALTLVMRFGLDAVTTEQIAQEAGISLRTFFNYYHNKEAAIVGPVEGLDCGLLAGFAEQDGRLIDDFAQLIAAQWQLSQPRKEVIRSISAVVAANPALRLAFDSSLELMTGQIADALGQRRRPLPVQARVFTAAVLMKAVGNASVTWGGEADMSVADLIDRIRDQLEQLLCALGHSKT